MAAEQATNLDTDTNGAAPTASHPEDDAPPPISYAAVAKKAQQGGGP